MKFAISIAFHIRIDEAGNIMSFGDAVQGLGFTYTDGNINFIISFKTEDDVTLSVSDWL